MVLEAIEHGRGGKGGRGGRGGGRKGGGAGQRKEDGKGGHEAKQKTSISRYLKEYIVYVVCILVVFEIRS